MSFELERGGGRFKDRIVGFVFPNSIVSESGGFPEYTRKDYNCNVGT